MDKKNERNRDGIEAVRRNYNCYGRHGCLEAENCVFGSGCNTAFDCCECGADEFYEGYLEAVKDMEKKRL